LWLPPADRNYSVVVQLKPLNSYSSWGHIEILVDGSVNTEGLYTGKLQVRRLLKAAGFLVVAKAA